VLLSGRDPAAWPNAELALTHLEHDRGTAEVRMIGPVTYGVGVGVGVGVGAQRYWHELETGRWTLAGGWDAPAQTRSAGHRQSRPGVTGGRCAAPQLFIRGAINTRTPRASRTAQALRPLTQQGPLAVRRLPLGPERASPRAKFTRNTAHLAGRPSPD
jgi:hypothetical protein